MPQSKLEAVDAFVPKCEPITNFLETVDYLLSLRFLFQPLGGLGTDSAKVRHVQNSAMTSLNLTKWLEVVWEALAEEDPTKRDDMLGSANTFLKQHSYAQEVDMHN